jgi:hypothetical protein
MIYLEYDGRQRLLDKSLLFLPEPDNENLELLGDFYMTPAELMQWAKRRKRRICRDLVADALLWRCPEIWRDWHNTRGIEQLLLRQCWGICQA